MSKNEIRYLVDSNIEQITVMLMKEHDLSLLEALNQIYNSQWYEKLMQSDTGLYYQSPNYNYLLLKDEMKYGKL